MDKNEIQELKFEEFDWKRQCVYFCTNGGVRCAMTRELLEQMVNEFASSDPLAIEGHHEQS